MRRWEDRHEGRCASVPVTSELLVLLLGNTVRPQGKLPTPSTVCWTSLLADKTMMPQLVSKSPDSPFGFQRGRKAFNLLCFQKWFLPRQILTSFKKQNIKRAQPLCPQCQLTVSHGPGETGSLDTDQWGQSTWAVKSQRPGFESWLCHLLAL